LKDVVALLLIMLLRIYKTWAMSFKENIPYSWPSLILPKFKFTRHIYFSSVFISECSKWFIIWTKNSQSYYYLIKCPGQRWVIVISSKMTILLCKCTRIFSFIFMTHSVFAQYMNESYMRVLYYIITYIVFALFEKVDFTEFCRICISHSHFFLTLFFTFILL